LDLGEPVLREAFNGISFGFYVPNVIEGRSGFGDFLSLYDAWMTRTRAPHLTMIESAPPNQIGYGYGYEPMKTMPPRTLEFARTFYPYMRLGLALTLLNDGYFAHEIGDTWHGNDWWYDELNFNLGAPFGPARRFRERDARSKLRRRPMAAYRRGTTPCRPKSSRPPQLTRRAPVRGRRPPRDLGLALQRRETGGPRRAVADGRDHPPPGRMTRQAWTFGVRQITLVHAVVVNPGDLP
jgi:hypothetical protein